MKQYWQKPQGTFLWFEQSDGVAVSEAQLLTVLQTSKAADLVDWSFSSDDNGRATLTVNCCISAPLEPPTSSEAQQASDGSPSSCSDTAAKSALKKATDSIRAFLIAAAPLEGLRSKGLQVEATAGSNLPAANAKPRCLHLPPELQVVASSQGEAVGQDGSGNRHAICASWHTAAPS
jgi:hypothetical protein